MTAEGVPLKPRTIGMGALIAVCLYISGLLVILTPLPLVYVSAMAGRKNGIVTAVVSFILVVTLYAAAFILPSTASGSPFFAIPLPGLGFISYFSSAAIEVLGSSYFLFFITIALVLGEAVRHHWGIIRGGGSALAAGLILTFIVTVALHFLGAIDLIQGMRGYLKFIVTEIVQIQETAGVANIQTTLLKEHGSEVASFVLHIIPSLIFVFALVSVVMNLLLSRRFIRLPHLFSGHVWDVAAFRIPDACVWGVIASGLTFYLGRYVVDVAWLKFLGVNVLIALAAVYFFQGLAVTSYFLRGLKFPIMRILAYVLIILFFQTVGLLMIGLGVADVWVDFRRRIHNMRTS